MKAVRKENSGHGGTIYWGYCYALAQGADYIFQTDSDRQTIPDEFWKIRRNYDIVMGNRSKREDGKLRIFVTQSLRIILKMVFHIKVECSLQIDECKCT